MSLQSLYFQMYLSVLARTPVESTGSIRSLVPFESHVKPAIAPWCRELLLSLQSFIKYWGVLAGPWNQQREEVSLRSYLLCTLLRRLWLRIVLRTESGSRSEASVFWHFASHLSHTRLRSVWINFWLSSKLLALSRLAFPRLEIALKSVRLQVRWLLQLQSGFEFRE